MVLPPGMVHLCIEMCFTSLRGQDIFNISLTMGQQLPNTSVFSSHKIVGRFEQINASSRTILHNLANSFEQIYSTTKDMFHKSVGKLTKEISSLINRFAL